MGTATLRSLPPYATRKMKQPNTSSLLVCLPSNFGSASFSPKTCPLWCPPEEPCPSWIGGKGPGRRFQNSIGRDSILLSYLVPGSSGNSEITACLMNQPQMFKLLSRLSRMKPICGLLGVLRPLVCWA